MTIAMDGSEEARRDFRKMGVTLALLGLLGPAAIDMYIPALPAMAIDLDTTDSAVQATLMAYFVAFGLAQLGYGPVSDAIGRKIPIYFGVGVFALASLGCILSQTIETLVLFRFLQGFGAAAAMAIPRAVIRDRYTGIAATKMMALVMLVISIGPMLAPTVGALLIAPFGWRATFIAMLFFAAMSIYMTAWILPETHPVDRRIPLNFNALRKAVGTLFRDPVYLGLTFIGGLGMAAFFAFLAESAFVYQEHFGLSEQAYAVAFGINALSFFGGAQFAAKLGERFTIPRVIFTAGFAFFALTVLNLGLRMAGIDSFWVVAGILFLGGVAMGLVVPTTMILALEDHGPIAGMAASLGGALQMMAGATSIAIAGIMPGTGSLPMLATTALCGLGIALIAITLRPRLTP